MEPRKTAIEQLTDYIKNNLVKGYNQDTLRFSLISQGYSKISVEKALENANKEIAETVPEMKEKPQISYRQIINRNQEMEISQPTKKKGFFKSVFG
tara:strand:+ start:1912 stop:2199 length:288 start_codon:yes stop_codon:yes gene_type:complete